MTDRSSSSRSRARTPRQSGVVSVAVIVALLGAARAAKGQALDVVHAFVPGAGIAFPEAALIQFSDGTFYGTSAGGGAYGLGTVFTITAGGVVSIRYSFQGIALSEFGNGAAPQAPLVLGNDGNFYGTTNGPLSGPNLTAFKMTPDGVVTRLILSTTTFPPTGPFIQATDGSLYVALEQTGLGQIDSLPAGRVATLPIPTPGQTVGIMGPLAQAADGNFYGTSSRGGALDQGTVFRWNPTGTFAILHEFAGGADGANPRSIIQGADGNFYGVTQAGGTFSAGTLFTMTPAGTVTVLHAFTGGTDGTAPSAPLIQATDGHFYGVVSGGAANQGVIFTMTTDGTFTVVPDPAVTAGCLEHRGAT
jgi:uncharacterized repeat protein (TIGR03803 family)